MSDREGDKWSVLVSADKIRTEKESHKVWHGHSWSVRTKMAIGKKLVNKDGVGHYRLMQKPNVK